MRVESTPSNIEKAALLLQAGEVLAMPTETVYGLACDACNPSAVRKVFQIKGRPAHNPLIIHLADSSQISNYATCTPQQLEQLSQLNDLWPGPLTVVLPSNGKICREARAGGDSIAIRIPAHPVAQELIRRSGLAIAAPSANQSGYVSPTLAKHVEDSLGEAVSLILDGGPCTVGIESTVVSLLQNRPLLLRPGAVTLEMLNQRLGEVEVFNSGLVPTGALQSPGLLSRHYSPKTPIFFSSELPSSSGGQKLGLICFSHSSTYPQVDYQQVATLSDSGNLAEIATKLFSCIREFDQLGLDAIVVDSLPEEGLGVAIMDRLKRAVSKE